MSRSATHFHTLFLGIALFLALAVQCAREVHVSVLSTHTSTPLLHEALEYINAEYGPHEYWKTLHALHEDGIFRNTTCNDACVYNALLRSAHVDRNILEWALATRHYTPIVYAQNQIAQYNHTIKQLHDSTTYPFLLCTAPIHDFQPTNPDYHVPLHVTTETHNLNIFHTDHIYPTPHSSDPITTTCVLHSKYDANFAEFHATFVHWLEANTHVRYFLRPFSDAVPRNDSMHSREITLDTLQGYLVELQIKNMEYKTLLTTSAPNNAAPSSTEHTHDAYIHGINFDNLHADFPAFKNQLDKFEQHLRTQKHEDHIKIWDMKDFGVQVAFSVMQNTSLTHQLNTLTTLSQNFPQFIQQLSAVRVPNEFRHRLQQSRLQSGANVVQINGQQLNLDKLSIFTLYNIFLQEHKLRATFEKIWDGTNVIETTLHKLFNMFLFKRPLLSTDHRFNMFHTTQANTLRTVLYLNDIETEPKYKRFPHNLSELLQPSYYGRLRWVSRHTFEALFMVDPSKLNHLQIIQSVLSLLNAGYPIRMGFVFAPSRFEEMLSCEQQQIVQVDLTGQSHAAGTAPQNPSQTPFSLEFDLCALVYYVQKTYGTQVAMQFLTQNVSPLLHHSLFDENTLKRAIAANDNTQHDTTIRDDWGTIQRSFFKQLQYLHSSGLTGLSDPLLILNGKMTSMVNVPPQHVPQYLFSHIQQEYPFIQSLISQNVLRDDTKDIQMAILDSTRALSRYHAQIFSKNPIYLTPHLLCNEENHIEHLVKVTHLSSSNAHDDNLSKPVRHSYHLCINANEDSQWNLVRALVKHISLQPKTLRSQYSFRILHNQQALSFVAKERIQTFNTEFGALDVDAADFMERFTSILSRQSSHGDVHGSVQTLDSLSDYTLCTKWLRFMKQKKNSLREDGTPQSSPKETSIIELNGRLIEVDAQFSMFDALENYQAPFVQFAEELIQESKAHANTASLAALVAADVAETQRVPPVTYSHPSNMVQSCSKTNYVCIDSLLESSTRHDYPFIHAQLNPLTEFGAIYSHILQEIYEHLKCPLQIVVNPVLEYTSLPLKSWYRFSFSPQLRFTNTTGERAVNHITFDSFNAQNSGQILTMNVKPPETWLLETTFARYDLDNIHLQSVDEDVLDARYQLKHIIISGSCFDDVMFTPPRGLQLYLDTPPHLHVQDTLVMSNFGYFQLKASPGFHELHIAPGKHSEVYQITGALVTDFYSQSSVADVDMPVDSQIGEIVSVPILHFEGPFVFLNVRRRPNQERADIFDTSESNAGGSMWQSVKNRVFHASNGDSPQDQDSRPTVHIFSVATGHLYERLMRIMMLSVVRHTKRSRVKFWILGNYLSPQFKEILPQMANDYGFEYGLVTYKWPSWLFKQTEKQRLIWAYKILFLDVLFPLDVKRIIFVDADQVSRTDMSELAEMDIKGRALAYTPFCSDRPEMEGYAFWTGGYWKNHLRGKPYHISALYLVDIQQLRRQYAADQYRSIYDNLARDPNSLSNLDQDLPNYAQHVVPIYSLPQNWLWCETWCSEKSKSKAKTIDLCNNPQTREHKTEAARRIIPEWEEYDREINVEYLEKLKKENGAPPDAQ